MSQILIIPRKKITDERGWFLKAINGNESGLPDYTGEIYFTCAKPGYTKGSHYHKKAKEWFTLISGKSNLWLTDITTGEKICIGLDADDPVTIYIPPFVAHKLENVSGSDFILCAYTDLIHDPADTISFDFQ